jgi:hypothetical protein
MVAIIGLGEAKARKDGRLPLWTGSTIRKGVAIDRGYSVMKAPLAENSVAESGSPEKYVSLSNSVGNILQDKPFRLKM